MSNRCFKTERIVQWNATTVIRTCDRLAGIKFDGTVKLVSPKDSRGIIPTLVSTVVLPLLVIEDCDTVGNDGFETVEVSLQILCGDVECAILVASGRNTPSLHNLEGSLEHWRYKKRAIVTSSAASAEITFVWNCGHWKPVRSVGRERRLLWCAIFDRRLSECK